jgi:hypothetical protein
MSSMGIFRASFCHPGCLRFPLNMQHSSEKDEFHIKKSIGYCVLKPHAIPAFLLTSLEERVVWGCCYMSIVVSFVAMVAKDLDTPF